MVSRVVKNRDSIQNVFIFAADTACIFLAYCVAGLVWMGIVKGMDMAYVSKVLGNNATTVLVCVLVQALFEGNADGFVTRSRLDEFKSVCKKLVIFSAIVAVYQLISKQDMPRGVYVLTVVFSLIFTYITRLIVKKSLMLRSRDIIKVSNIIAITTKRRVKDVVKQVKDVGTWSSSLTGIIVVDEDMTDRTISGYKVVANRATMMNYITRHVVDEIYVDMNAKNRESLKADMYNFEDMGIKVHLKLDVIDEFRDFNVAVGMMNEVPVVTIFNREFDPLDMMIKRIVDIIGGLVGTAMMLVALVIVGPLIKLESPGPVFFKQQRVGKNGRMFNIYKFRSMYVDAEQRKSDLMSQNEMNGLMFKMKNDPRITRVGRFIRKTSIDELPQFINVLKGDMSLVGTRPPTVGEFNEYEGHHKRRLSVKPGITGMWQAYGRNTVKDFDEVVKMDLKYIDNWSFGLDLKILMKTVVTVVTDGGE